VKSFIQFVGESPLAQLIDKHSDQFDFLHAAIKQIKAGKLKLKQRGVANTRELAAAWKKRKNK